MIIEKDNITSKKKKHKKDKSKKHKKHKVKENLDDSTLQDLEGVRAEIEACLKNDNSPSESKVVNQTRSYFL